MSVRSPEALAQAQLDAYNLRDIDAFCDCYSADVQVYGRDGALALDGAAAFRASYAEAFAAWDEFGAAVDRRVVDGDRVIDHERWWRARPGERREGRVRVTYTVRDGRIAVVRFTEDEG